MRFSTILKVLTFVAAAVAVTAASYNNTNTCFDMTKGHCVGRSADVKNATAAITNACEKVASCTPGETGHGRTTVTGKITGFPYTATLFVGDQCGGVASWSTGACIDLFKQFVDQRCEAQYPAGPDLFELGYVHAPCDQSYVSFNFGG